MTLHEKPSSFGNLHSEVLEHILLYLPPRDVYTCLFLSKRITAIAKRRPLHRHISIKSPTSMIKTMQHFLRNPDVRPLVRQMDVSVMRREEQKAPYQWALTELLPSLHTLNGLLLTGDDLHQQGMIDALHQRHQSLKHIRSVDGNIDLQKILRAVLPLSLDLFFHGYAEQVAKLHFGTILQQLRFSGMSFEFIEEENLLRKLPKSLITLQFDQCCDLTNRLMILIGHHCPQLQYLALNGCSIEDGQAVDRDADLLLPLKQLRRLAINHHFVTPLALSRLSGPLEVLFLDDMENLNVGWVALALGHWKIAADGMDLMVRHGTNLRVWLDQEYDILEELCVKHSVRLRRIFSSDFQRYQHRFELYNSPWSRSSYR